MRFCAQVRWSPEGTLRGEITADDAPPEPFYGVMQLVGLIEAHLGQPARDHSGSAETKNQNPRRLS